LYIEIKPVLTAAVQAEFIIDEFDVLFVELAVAVAVVFTP
jgi:hypothetical protein